MKSMYVIIMMTTMLSPTTWSFIFIKQRHDELEHLSLITEWKSDMDKNAYKKQAK